LANKKKKLVGVKCT